MLIVLQFRCGEWGEPGQVTAGRRRLALSRLGAAKPSSAPGVLPLPLGLGLRDVSQVHVPQLLHRQREVCGRCSRVFMGKLSGNNKKKLTLKNNFVLSHKKYFKKGKPS